MPAFLSPFEIDTLLEQAIEACDAAEPERWLGQRRFVQLVLGLAARHDHAGFGIEPRLRVEFVSALFARRELALDYCLYGHAAAA
jgi:hypothetical protein